MPELFFDLAELLRCYISVRRSRLPDWSGLPSISVADIESCYRLYAVGEWLTAREFTEVMFELDTVAQEHYKAANPKRD